MPDIILLDLTMPSMSGTDALPLLRECAPGALIIVVAGDIAGREEALRELGADSCLLKTGDRWLGLGPALYSMWEEFSRQSESA
jgi:CheY-like chemotaxis protein